MIFRTVPDGEVFRDALETTWAFESTKIPEPWAAGPRSMFVRLPCVQLTGRRVIPSGR